MFFLRVRDMIFSQISIRCILLMLILISVCRPVFATNRIALVIGNNDYENVIRLDKAISDSETISKTLALSGFNVIQAGNLNRRSMKSENP